MITNIFLLATVFLIAVYLMVLQEMRHQKKKKSLEDRIAGLQDAILSKQRDYTAAKEEIKKLVYAREQLEKDLATSQRLGKDWLDLRDKEIEARTNAMKDLDKELAAGKKTRDELETLKFKYAQLEEESKKWIRELREAMEEMRRYKTYYEELQPKYDESRKRVAELERITRKHEALKRNFSSLNERHAALKKKQEQDIQRLMRENFGLKSKLEIQKEDSDQRNKELKQAKELNVEYRALNAELARRNNHLTVDVDRTEEDYHNLLVLSQDYLRRMKLPKIRVEEYTRLAEARRKSKEPDLTTVVFASQDGLDPAVSDDKTADLRF